MAEKFAQGHQTETDIPNSSAKPDVEVEKQAASRMLEQVLSSPAATSALSLHKPSSNDLTKDEAVKHADTVSERKDSPPGTLNLTLGVIGGIAGGSTSLNVAIEGKQLATSNASIIRGVGGAVAYHLANSELSSKLDANGYPTLAKIAQPQPIETAAIGLTTGLGGSAGARYRLAAAAGTWVAGRLFNAAEMEIETIGSKLELNK